MYIAAVMGTVYNSLPLSSKISPISMKQGSASASLLPSPSSP